MPISKILMNLTLQAVAARGTAVLDREKCLGLSRGEKFCTLCQRSCPAEAMEIDSRAPEIIDPLSCSGCGICTAVCPLEAIKLKDSPGDEDILKQAGDYARQGQKRIVFVCREKSIPSSRKGMGWIKINCMGRLEESLLLGCFARGIEKIIIMTERCGKKCAPDTAPAIERHLQDLKEKMEGYLEQISLPAALKINPSEEEAEEGEVSFSRRELFGRFKKEMSGVTREVADAALNNWENLRGDTSGRKKRRDVSPRASFRRELFFTSLSHLNISFLPPELAELNLKKIDEGTCRFCLACRRICPTGAIKAEKGEERLSIWHAPKVCAGCRACEIACPEGSIAGEKTAMDGNSFAYQCVLDVPREFCDLCDAPISGNGDGLCVLCRKEQGKR